MIKYRVRYLVLAALLLSGCEADRDEFAIEMLPLNGGNWEAIRYNVNTGVAWSAQQGVWVEIADPETLPRSNYVIKLVAAGDNGWGAIRLDTDSGRTWSASGGTWIEIRQ